MESDGIHGDARGNQALRELEPGDAATRADPGQSADGYPSLGMNPVLFPSSCAVTDSDRFWMNVVRSGGWPNIPPGGPNPAPPEGGFPPGNRNGAPPDEGRCLV